jgi:HSP20 family molecular chaperone IbpA
MKDSSLETKSATTTNVAHGTSVAAPKPEHADLRNVLTPLKLVSADVLRDRGREIQDTIARHAYRIFEIRGREHGHDREDWLAAEREVLHLCRRDLKELSEKIVSTFELGGSFTADQLNVCVEPHRVTVSGERNITCLSEDGSGAHEKRRPQHVFRILDLPAEVDPSGAAATLNGETLEIVMPKRSALEQGNVTTKAASSGRS